MPALRRSALITLAVRANLVERLWFSHLRVCRNYTCRTLAYLVLIGQLPVPVPACHHHAAAMPTVVCLLTLQGMQAAAGRALPVHISEWGPPLILLARVHR